jgi:hypothetical protein
MKTLNEQYQQLKKGKGHKDVFLKEARSKFPQWIRNASTLKETTTILKNKGIINESLVNVKSTNQLISPSKESYETAFSNFLKEAKAEEKNTTKEVIDLEIAGYDYKDKEDPNNMIFDQIMKGYYIEMKNPKNSEKTMEELKDMVIKNLAKDPIYYTKNGQFGIEDLGYQTEAPGLGKGKQVKNAGAGGGYGEATKKDFPEGQVGTGYIEVPNKIEGSGLEVIDVTTLNENKDSNNTTENLHEQKLRKVINNIIREELNENVQKELKSIDKEAEVETIKMKIERIEAAIEKRQAQLSKLDEDEDLKNLTDKKKLKALGKDIKVLEKAKAKLEKTLAKLTGKKKKEVLDEDTVTEAEGDAEEAKETADELERAADAAKEIGDTELFEEDDEVDYRKESLTKIANEAEEMFEKLTGRDGSPDGLDDMDALKNVLSEFPAYMGEEIEFVEKHLMGKYDLGNA